MSWLYLLLALAAIVVAFKASSLAVVLVCLLVAFGLVLVWVMGILAQRVEDSSRDVGMMIDPTELRRLREQAEARKLAEANNAAPPHSDATH
ncbi:hypothetical protein [Montanilutibacter psychrotolerans]|uniref:Uncharacterized protein n=1 Tax=Montanilutibacter psychrotolerans TaxID=1327343 RepID=A0A3M8SQS0_9GAMM|nr:hypothetical protein [Lysobacter psychrotolerans]RNF83678.1 hypothetical protein EER27_09870 [Lysobacter psychrotolerans]